MKTRAGNSGKTDSNCNWGFGKVQAFIRAKVIYKVNSKKRSIIGIFHFSVFRISVSRTYGSVEHRLLDSKKYEVKVNGLHYW